MLVCKNETKILYPHDYDANCKIQSKRDYHIIGNILMILVYLR